MALSVYSAIFRAESQTSLLAGRRGGGGGGGGRWLYSQAIYFHELKVRQSIIYISFGYQLS